MIKEKIVIKNPIGIHLRPAGEIAEAAIKFKKCDISYSILLVIRLQYKYENGQTFWICASL